MRWHLALILFSVILALCWSKSAQAYIIQANPAETTTILKTLEEIPPCTWNHIANHFKKIKVLPHGRLGIKKINGRTYYIQADTWFMRSSTYLDQHHVDDATIMHEMGHWYYLDVIGAQYRQAWQMAVDLDFTQMNKVDQYDDAYLRDSEEAFAELFAANLLSDKYWKNPYYQPDAMPHSEALLDEILRKTCPNDWSHK